MPNWCENYLTVKGDIKYLMELDRLTEPVLDFNKIIEYPEIYARADKKRQKWNEEYVIKVKEKVDGNMHVYEKIKDNAPERPMDGFNNGGYEWRIENWGTKWNVSVYDFEKNVCYEGNSIHFSFDTAWTPPLPILKELSKKFPTLFFIYEWRIEGFNYTYFAAFKNSHQLVDCDADLSDLSDYELKVITNMNNSIKEDRTIESGKRSPDFNNFEVNIISVLQPDNQKDRTKENYIENKKKNDI